MLQDMIAQAPAHIPYLLAIILGGLAGNSVADRQIKLPAPFFIVLAFAFVASLVGSAYCLEHGPWLTMVLLNAVTAGCLSFALTCGGDFVQPRAIYVRESIRR